MPRLYPSWKEPPKKAVCTSEDLKSVSPNALLRRAIGMSLRSTPIALPPSLHAARNPDSKRKKLRPEYFRNEN